MVICEYCGKSFYAGDGLWDNSDYMCGECVASRIEEAGRARQQPKPAFAAPHLSDASKKPGRHE